MILLHFTIIHALDYIYYICVVEILTNGVLLRINHILFSDVMLGA